MKKKPRKKKWIAFLLFCAVLFLFRKPLMIGVVKGALAVALPSDCTLTYANMSWKDDVICIEQLLLKDDEGLNVSIDHVAIALHGLEVNCGVFQPYIHLCSDSTASALPLALLGSKHLFWEVQEGMVQLDEQPPLYFDFSSRVGHLHVTCEPNEAPLLIAKLTHQSEGMLDVEFVFEEKELSAYLPLARLIYPQLPTQWEAMEGQMQIQGSVRLDAHAAVKNIAGHLHAEHLFLQNQIKVQAEQVDIDFITEDPQFFWEQSQGRVALRGVEFFAPGLRPEHFSIEKAEMILEPDKEPFIDLKGSCVHEKTQFDLALQGSGEFLSDTSFILGIKMQCGPGKSQMLEADLSLCQFEKGKYALQATFQNFLPVHLDFLSSCFALEDKWWLEGAFAGKATLLFEKNELQRLSIEEGKFISSRWQFPQAKSTVFAEECAVECVLSKTEAFAMDAVSIALCGGSGVVSTEEMTLYVDHLQADLQVEHSELTAVHAVMQSGGVQAEITAQSPRAGAFAQLVLQGSAPNCDHAYAQICQDLQAQVLFNAQKKEIAAEGVIHLGEEIVKTTAYFESPSSIASLLDLAKVQFREAEVEIETQAQASIWKKIFPRLALNGALQLKANVDPSHAVISLQGSDCFLQHALGDLFLPSFKEDGAKIVYQWKEKKCQAHLPLQDARVNFRDSGLSVNSMDADLFIDCVGEDWSLHGVCEHIDCRLPNEQEVKEGKCKIAFDSKEQKLQIEKARAYWMFKPEMTCQLTLPLVCADFSKEPLIHFQGGLDFKERQLIKCQGAAQYIPKKGWEFKWESARLLDVPLHFSHCAIDDAHRIRFEMHSKVSTQTLNASLKWMTQVGILSSDLPLPLPVEGTINATLATENLDQVLRFKLESQDIMCKGQKLFPMLVRGNKKGESWNIEEAKAGDLTFKARAQLQDHAAHVEDFEGQYKGFGLKASGKMDLISKDFSINVDQLQGYISHELLGGKFLAYGKLKGDLKNGPRYTGEAVCTLDVAGPVALTAWNVKPLTFRSLANGGIEITDFGAYLKSKKEGIVIGSFSARALNILLEKQDFAATSLQFSLNPLFLKELAPSVFQGIEYQGEHFEGSGDVRYAEEQLTCRIGMKDGKYGLNGNTFFLEQLGLQCERGVFTLQAKSQVGEQPLWAALSLSMSKNPQGIVRITDSPKNDGIRIHFKTVDAQIKCEKVQGTCCGLTCQLKKSESKKFPGAVALSGHLDLDASQVNMLFNKTLREKIQKMQLGKGYHWQGELAFVPKRGLHMTGEISGEEWELLGYRFKNLRAGLDVNPTHVHLSNILIQDAAGSVAIKKIEIDKKENWELCIPLVNIREWHPSSMHKVDAPASAIKPFTIRNFTLSNIHADFGRQDSLQGQGHLTFTNQFKKESTLFDTPLEMIKNIGLDPGILTPVQGEVELDLRGDKFYFVTLKNAYSEARRSEFYLAPGRDLSYIDLDGKMQIDLKMRQEVMLKVTEAFILTIRGTLEKPRYGLMY